MDTYCLSDLMETYEDEARQSRVCQCGHVYAEHDIFDALNDCDELSPCEADGCDCEAFTEDQAADRGMNP